MYNSDSAYFNDDISAWDTSSVTTMYFMFAAASYFNQPIGGWDVSKVRSMNCLFHMATSFNGPIGDWNLAALTDMDWMFIDATSFNQNLGWCLDNDVEGYYPYSFKDTRCASTSCGVTQRDENGLCIWPTPRPTYIPSRSPTQAPVPRDTSSSSGGADAGPAGPIIGAVAGALLLLAIGALWFYRRRKGSETKPSDAVDLPPKPLEPLKARPEEEATVLSVAPEAEQALPEQLPPPPAKGWFAAPEPESAPAAPAAEEMYYRIAAWYNSAECDALRDAWGAYPEPGEFQTWPGFVTVTNAFLDREPEPEA